MPNSEKLIIQQLRQLVATPSVSSTDPGWDQGNRAVIDLLAGWLADLGFRTEIQPVSADGSKANLIATLGSGPGGLVLAGHTDTVPFDEGRWQSDPLGLNERDQRLYGLGSTDMKGFFPLAIAAASAFRDTPLKHPLIVLATADEESSMNGARALVEAGRPKARAAIIGEPTSLVPVRMHKGIMMEAVQITGRAGHSSNPALGNSALEGMHTVMGDLMTYREGLRERYGVSQVLDLSPVELEGRYLEGTGALVLDHVHRIAYMARSGRANEAVLDQWCEAMGYTAEVFDTVDQAGQPIYHTNVVLSIATNFVVAGLSNIPDPAERARIAARLGETGRDVVKIDRGQVAEFAGNGLELTGSRGRIFTLSTRALAALRPDQIAAIETSARILAIGIPTIERSGGSVRCMLAGIHLPPRQPDALTTPAA